MSPALVPPRSYEPELMDREGNTYEEQAGNLRDIARVNRWLGGIATLRRPLREMIRRDGLAAFTLLDVGTGGGEVPQALVAWARRSGIEARAAGLDLDPHMVRYARERTGRERRRGGTDGTAAGDGGPDTKGPGPLCLLRADGFRLPFPDASFDFVTSSLMFHHFTEPDAARLLAELARVSRRAVVVNDLARHRIPWAVITVLAALGGTRMVRHDGPLSVLRGWQPPELLALATAQGLAHRARVRRLFPYRLVLVVERGTA